MYINVTSSSSPVSTPCMASGHHMALGVPRESYTSPRCIPLLLLFHSKLYSMFASMGVGSWAFSVALMKLQFAAGTESQRSGLPKCS